jgi:hypothetical protein
VLDTAHTITCVDRVVRGWHRASERSCKRPSLQQSVVANRAEAHSSEVRSPYQHQDSRLEPSSHQPPFSPRDTTPKKCLLNDHLISPASDYSNIRLSSAATLQGARRTLPRNAQYVTSAVSATLAQPCLGGAAGLQDQPADPSRHSQPHLTADLTFTLTLTLTLILILIPTFTISLHLSQTTPPRLQTTTPHRHPHSITLAALPANCRHVRL